MMARRYNVPHSAIANCATSKSSDIQAGFDDMWGLFPAVLAGANWITVAGGMLEGALTLSYAKTVLNFEQCEAMYHFARGCDFGDLDEIFETVCEVGPDGHFLGAAHTRKSDLFIFESQNNVTYEQWQEEGRRSAAEVGVEKARRMLARYEPPPIEDALDQALLDFIARRTAEIPPLDH